MNGRNNSESNLLHLLHTEYKESWQMLLLVAHRLPLNQSGAESSQVSPFDVAQLEAARERYQEARNALAHHLIGRKRAVRAPRRVEAKSNAQLCAAC
jgi:hypothetical protein